MHTSITLRKLDENEPLYGAVATHCHLRANPGHGPTAVGWCRDANGRHWREAFYVQVDVGTRSRSLYVCGPCAAALWTVGPQLANVINELAAGDGGNTYSVTPHRFRTKKYEAEETIQEHDVGVDESRVVRAQPDEDSQPFLEKFDEERCWCGEQKAFGGVGVEIDGIFHRISGPCYHVEAADPSLSRLRDQQLGQDVRSPTLISRLRAWFG